MNKNNLSNPKIDEVSKYLSPSHPINSFEFLEGRIDELEKIDDILSFGGRSAFIVGDRGVGKTSLAQTAAIIHTHSKYDYVYTACDPKPYGTFGKITKDMLIKLAQLVSEHHNDSMETKSTMGIVLSTNPSVKFTREWSDSKSSHEIPEPEGASDVIRYLKGFGKILKNSLCIVLDELENLESEECKANLAHLIKQIGDQEIPFKFVFAGIAGTPDKLIGLHESTSRYYGAITLEPLKAQPIIDIVKKASDHFQLSIPDEQFYRIYTISCGYPHYPHLIGSKMIIHLLKEELKRSTSKSFVISLNKAVEDSQPFLINKYKKATMNRSNKVKNILWAIASHRDIDQKSSDIYTRYSNLHYRYSTNFEKLTQKQISASIHHFAKPEYGQILIKHYKNRPFYAFTDPLMRGFIRLKAASIGIEIANDEI
ncbi:MAG: ATP-binding protein [Desulfobacula sp.]|nr:ATP-binding protein [Desulfobacula sp.]